MPNSDKGWKPIETVPNDGACLVWLEEPMLGSRVQVSKRHKSVSSVGGLFHFDAPKATHWMELPEGPALVADSTARPSGFSKGGCDEKKTR